MKHIDLFSGIGGFALAARWTWGDEYENIFFCDNNKFCQEVLKKNFGKNSIIYGDIRDVKASGNEGEIDLLTGGWPCFGKGTSILTYDGYKPIEKIKIGDLVLTHLGNWKKVTSIMKRKNAKLYKITGQGILPTIVTDEHPYYANGGNWINVKDLKRGDKICQVIPQNEIIDNYSEDFWWLVGRYMADGWRTIANKKGRVVICCNRKESEYLKEKITKAGFNSHLSSERTCDKFHITRKCFYDFLKPFGTYAHGKTIPGFVFELEKNKLQQFLDGYFSGDGYINKSSKYPTRRVTTVSKELALGVALLIQKAYGVIAYIRSYKPKGEKYIEGRLVKQRRMYFVTIPPKNKLAYVNGIYGWKWFREKKANGHGIVYNISVEGDESYVANGAVVHNCQPHSIAGKRLGTKDERHLWPEMQRIINEFKPRWVIGENVPGIISIEDGVVFEQVCTDLEKMAYEVQPFIIPACAVGAPHKRDRVWVVAHSTNTANNKLPRLEGRMQSNFTSELYRGQNTEWDKNWIEVATELCGVDDGLPVALDGFELSASKHRIERLKALGNAIVPQVAYVLMKTIKDIEDGNYDKGIQEQFSDLLGIDKKKILGEFFE